MYAVLDEAAIPAVSTETTFTLDEIYLDDRHGALSRREISAVAASSQSSGSPREATLRGMRHVEETVAVPIERLDLTQQGVAAAVIELQRRAYGIEAELIGSDEIPQLSETLEELQASGETFLGAYLEGTLVGAISWRVDAAVLDLHRLVVDPNRFRAGIGAALVRAALAAEPEADRAVVQTGSSNEPAKQLYRREGFEEIDEVEVVPGLRVTRFGRRL